MTPVSTVIVGDVAGPVWEAVGKLGAMVGQGLISPFWFVDSKIPRSGDWPGVRFGEEGPVEVRLFTSIGEDAAGQIRVAAVATPGDAVRARQVAEVADEVQRQLQSLAPSDASARVARLWFPDWETLAAPDDGYFSTHVDANLVLIPEDRRSDQHFGAPLAPDTPVFAGHIAAETASIMGMFAGMEGSLLDDLGPGVIFGSNPKVRLARSFLRIGRSPALPLQEIVDHEGLLPVPPGTVEAPSPSAAVADLAGRADSIFEPLLFEVRDPEPLQRHQLRPLQTLGLVVREMGRFIAGLPRRAVEGLFEDFSELAGRTMQDLVGSSSVVEVVWRGKFGPRMEGGSDHDALIADLKHQAERRLDLEGGPSIDQTVWRDLRTLVLSTADGSEPPGGIAPIELHGRRTVVNDAEALAPRPEEDLVGTAKSILDESESGTPVTLVGRLGARIEQIASSNRTAVSRLLGMLDVQMAALAHYRPPGFAFWHIAGSVLLAALVVSLLLLTGLVRDWGITEMAGTTKNLLFGALTLACVSGLAVLRSYARSASSEGSKTEGERLKPVGVGLTWFGGFLGACVAGIFVALAVAFLGYPPTEPASYSAVLAGIVTGAGLGQAYSLATYQEHLPALGRMSRLSILVVLSYVSVVVIGAISQPEGWYATASDQELSDLLGPVTGSLAFLLFWVLVYVSWRRVQERLEVRGYGQTIRQLAEQVDAAFTGDRVADAAREQFLGLSAVLSRLIWFPYGKETSMPDTGVDLVDLGVKKAAVCQFGLSARGAGLFEARTKRLASERGWLTAQYEGSIQAFREDQAVMVGSDDPTAVVRPDQDPKTVAQYDAEARPEKGERWRWADRFFAGVYDAHFLHALEVHGEKEVFGPILADSANFEPIGDGTGRGLLDFMSEVFPRGDGEADPRYFDPDHLAGGGFERTWQRRTWWPRERLFDTVSAGEQRSIESIGSLTRGAVWVAVRVDMTEDLEPAAIFGRLPGGEVSLPETAGPDF